MSDRFFLDSNIVIYALNDETAKKSIAIKLLESNPILSTQVLSEVSSVFLNKFHLKHSLVAEWIDILSAQTEVVLISPETIALALKISHECSYRFYDSLIISAALQSGAKILYSEDMHHYHQIQHLKIINPFHAPSLGQHPTPITNEKSS